MTSLSKIISRHFNLIDPSNKHILAKKYEWVIGKLGTEKCKQILKDNLQSNSISLLYKKYKEDKFLNNYPTNIRNSNRRLKYWDNLGGKMINANAFKEFIDDGKLSYSLCDLTCIAKETARLLCEDYERQTEIQGG